MDLMAADMFAKITSAQAEIEAMKVANHIREMLGESPAYGEGHFYAICEQMRLIGEQISNCYR